MDAKMDAKMDATLEKIEMVKDKTGVTYKEAKDALEATNENVVEAIIKIEEEVNNQKGVVGTWKDELTSRIQEIINKGNVTRIKVRKGRLVLINLPIIAGAVGIAMAPTASIVGIIAAFGFKCTVEIQKDDGTSINLTKKAEAYYDYAKERAPEYYEMLKAKGLEKYGELKESDTYKSLKAKGDETLGLIEAEVSDIKAKSGDFYALIKEKEAEISKRKEKTAKRPTRKSARSARETKAKKAEFIDSLKTEKKK